MPKSYPHPKNHGHPYAQLKQVFDQHFGPLQSAGVTVDTLEVEAADKDGQGIPAIKVNGMPVAARIKVNNAELRAQDHADATIFIDARAWKDMNEGQQLAYLDSCLDRLEVEELGVDANGGAIIYATNDDTRPKLTMKKPDWLIEGTVGTANRHGENSPGVISAREFANRFGDVTINAPITP